jgi:hypothetical protein
LRYVWWQMRSRLKAEPNFMPWGNGTRLLLEPAMRGPAPNLYSGLLEWPDIGANEAPCTVSPTGAGACRWESFAPVAATYQRLRSAPAFTVLGERI